MVFLRQKLQPLEHHKITLSTVDWPGLKSNRFFKSGWYLYMHFQLVLSNFFEDFAKIRTKRLIGHCSLNDIEHAIASSSGTVGNSMLDVIEGAVKQ